MVMVSTSMGDHPTGSLQNMENQVCLEAKTGKQMAPEIVVRLIQKKRDATVATKNGIFLVLKLTLLKLQTFGSLPDHMGS